MGDKESALRRKFAGLRAEAGRAVVLHGAKSGRCRLGLRVKAELFRDLHAVKLVTGGELNSLCEEMLAEATAARVAKLKSGMAPGEWDGILRCATIGK